MTSGRGGREGQLSFGSEMSCGREGESQKKPLVYEEKKIEEEE